MPIINTSVVGVGIDHLGKTHDERSVLHMVGPMPTGKTLIKRNGEWYCKRIPGTRELEAAEHYFLGGHEYEISDELYLEIYEALSGTACMPSATGVAVPIGLFPSSETFPSEDTYPIEAA